MLTGVIVIQDANGIGKIQPGHYWQDPVVTERVYDPQYRCDVKAFTRREIRGILRLAAVECYLARPFCSSK